MQATTKRTSRAMAWDYSGRPILFWDAPPDRTQPVPFGFSLVADGVRHDCSFRSWRKESLGWQSAWGRLRHLGVHAYQRAITPNVREVVVQIDNSTTDFKAFLGSLYFASIYSTHQNGWNVIEHERPAYTGTQFFPSLASLTWRAVFWRKDGRDKAQHALAMGHLTPPLDFPRFGPSQAMLPVIHAAYDSRTGSLLSSLRTGIKNVGTNEEPGYYTTNLGPWHPVSDQQEGAVAGSGIFPYPKLGDPLYHALRSDGLMERNRIGGYDAADGSVIEAHRYAPQDYRLYRGSTWNQKLRIYSGGTVNDGWTEPFANSGVCAYETQIRNRRDGYGYSAFDVAHMIRGYLDDLAAYYLTGCPLHRLRMQLFAQDVMTSERETYTGPVDDPWSYSLAQRIRNAERNPHVGGDILRSEGWKMHVVAHTIAITPPSPMRDRMLSWGSRYLYLHETISPPAGVPKLGSKAGNDDNGEPWDLYGLAETKAEAPSWQQPICMAGLDELSHAVRGVSHEIVARSADAMYFGSCPYVKSEWNESIGLPKYIVTYDAGVLPNPIKEGVGPSNPIHFRDHLSRAHKATGNVKYLEAACRIDWPVPNVEALKNATKDTHEPWLFTTREATLRQAVPEPV